MWRELDLHFILLQPDLLPAQYYTTIVKVLFYAGFCIVIEEKKKAAFTLLYKPLEEDESNPAHPRTGGG